MKKKLKNKKPSPPNHPKPKTSKNTNYLRKKTKVIKITNRKAANKCKVPKAKPKAVTKQ